MEFGYYYNNELFPNATGLRCLWEFDQAGTVAISSDPAQSRHSGGFTAAVGAFWSTAGSGDFGSIPNGQSINVSAYRL